MKDGERKAIEWKEAFDLFASKMTAIQEKYGKESVAYISTGQLPTEEMALFRSCRKKLHGYKWRW